MTEVPREGMKVYRSTRPKAGPGERVVSLRENSMKPGQVTGWIVVSSEPGQSPPPELDGLLERPPQSELWPNLPKKEKN